MGPRLISPRNRIVLFLYLPASIATTEPHPLIKRPHAVFSKVRAGQCSTAPETPRTDRTGLPPASLRLREYDRASIQSRSPEVNKGVKRISEMFFRGRRTRRVVSQCLKVAIQSTR